jgi:hypothetical protein
VREGDFSHEGEREKESKERDIIIERGIFFSSKIEMRISSQRVALSFKLKYISNLNILSVRLSKWLQNKIVPDALVRPN